MAGFGSDLFYTLHKTSWLELAWGWEDGTDFLEAVLPVTCLEVEKYKGYTFGFGIIVCGLCKTTGVWWYLFSPPSQGFPKHTSQPSHFRNYTPGPGTSGTCRQLRHGYRHSSPGPSFSHTHTLPRLTELLPLNPGSTLRSSRLL